jgi:sphingolipid delta-4 desaturase
MSVDYEWHVRRAREILARHPEIRACFRPYPLSLLPISGLVALQWTLAWQVGGLPWWAIGLCAFGVGQFVLHALATFIHEAAHNRILKTRRGKLFALLVIELGTLSFAKSLEYVAVHGPSHHRYLNDHLQDYEWWDAGQVRMLRSRRWWRALDALLGLLPAGVLVSDLLVARLTRNDPWRRIRRLDPPAWFRHVLLGTSIALYALAWWWLGWGAALYFLWTVSIMVGPWGITFKGQSIAEHDVGGQGRTCSTYLGWQNRLFFNTGYHDEHHTFPQVPWVDLPKVRRIAPEAFTNDSGRSYAGWWWRWARALFQPERFNRYREALLPGTGSAGD